MTRRRNTYRRSGWMVIPTAHAIVRAVERFEIVPGDVLDFLEVAMHGNKHWPGAACVPRRRWRRYTWRNLYPVEETGVIPRMYVNQFYWRGKMYQVVMLVAHSPEEAKQKVTNIVTVWSHNGAMPDLWSKS